MASTFVSVVPVEDMTVVFMTQLLPSSKHLLHRNLEQFVNGAVVEPGR